MAYTYRRYEMLLSLHPVTRDRRKEVTVELDQAGAIPVVRCQSKLEKKGQKAPAFVWAMYGP
jgi:hypothetical protein